MSNSSTTPATTLDRMHVGESAFVADISAHDTVKHGSLSDISRRLKELGFVRGEEVTILHKGYFGGEPLAVRVGQSTFALRNFEAALIGVTKSGIPA